MQPDMFGDQIKTREQDKQQRLIERNKLHLQKRFNEALKEPERFHFWRFIRSRWDYCMPMNTALTEDQQDHVLERWYDAAYWLQNELLGDSKDEFTDMDLVLNNYYLPII